MMKKLTVGLRLLQHDWGEALVQTFGPMMAQSRPFCLLGYQEDLTLVVICNELAELLESLIIDANTMDLRLQMAEKGVATMPGAPSFESIGAGYVLGGKYRRCRP